MNTSTRKKLLRLIFPAIVLIAMIVLIISARRRDARRTEELKNADSSTTTEASVESSAAESVVDENAVPVDGPAAASLDELEGTPVAVFDGKVFVSFAGFDEENSRMLIRLDNNMDAQLCTRAHPDTFVNGEKVVLNPLGPNQKLAAVFVEAGCYHIISYKVDPRCFTADTLTVTATLRMVADENHEETLDDYDLTIK